VSLRLNPITKKRWRRFREIRRAWYALLALGLLYGLTLCSEMICNDAPLLIWHQGRLYFPVWRFYPDDVFTGSGLGTRTDYRRLASRPDFVAASSWMLWPPLRSGPYDPVPIEELEARLRVSCRLEPQPALAGASIDAKGCLQRLVGAKALFGDEEPEWRGRSMEDFWALPPQLSAAFAQRFANQAGEAISVLCAGQGAYGAVTVSLPAYSPRAAAPALLRLSLSGQGALDAPRYAWNFQAGKLEPTREQERFAALPDPLRERLLEQVQAAFSGDNSRLELSLHGSNYVLDCEKELVRFPFRPVPGHWFGLDDAGRDVLARILYGLRSSLSFGLILVLCSLSIGTALGALQGYLGGWVDVTGQRLVEIWSALPFLYIVILMGSIYGPGFWLLIFCYALFNWIGMSYYMRAEMLRLRRQPFVEAARCLGLPGWRIVCKHLLPNALVPLITFFPFSLVGAIGSLAALDYLGFGLPPPTPSLGQLLQQAQSQRWAWWLILYPSLALFAVMLLGVLVGEGVREAFDPKRQSRYE
jgi:microcin C transport system permease protein